MTFTEDWYSDTACHALANLARSTKSLSGRIIEIGCWEGRSTVAIANAVNPLWVDAVDTWNGSPGEISERLASERDVYGQFTANVEALTAGNVRPHRTDWRDFVKDCGPIAFCHIDATHTYEEVADNLAAVLPLVVTDGVICGDDSHHEPVRRAVLDVLGSEVLVDGSLWQWRKPEETPLSRHYREACATPSDINQHLASFVELCQRLDAKKVVELGTRGGVSTIAWLYGLSLTGGKLWSVDIDPAPELPYDGWTFLLGDDLAPEIVCALPSEVDVVFIDTSHTYEQTTAELQVYSRKVRPGGRIVLHDTELRRPIDGVTTRQPPYPVKRAVDEFCTEEGLEWVNLPHCNGLGIISLP